MYAFWAIRLVLSDWVTYLMKIMAAQNDGHIVTDDEMHTMKY